MNLTHVKLAVFWSFDTSSLAFLSSLSNQQGISIAYFKKVKAALRTSLNASLACPRVLRSSYEILHSIYTSNSLQIGSLSCSTGMLSVFLQPVLPARERVYQQIVKSAPYGLRLLQTSAVRSTGTAPSPVTLAKRKLKALPKPSVTPPKKPIPAYFLFSSAQIQTLSKDPAFANKDYRAKLTAISREVSSRWERLPESEKKQYHAQAEKAKAQYERDYKNYLDKRTPTDVLLEKKAYRLKKSIKPDRVTAKPARDAKAPKAPLTSFARFFKDVYSMSPSKQEEVLGRSAAGLPPHEASKLVAAAYKRLPESEKKKYQTAYATEAEAYKKKIAAYRQSNGIDAARANLEKAIRANSAKKVPKKTVALRPVVKKTIARAKSVRGILAPKGKKVATKAAATAKSVAKKIQSITRKMTE
ncbi:uncharacterized protein SPPG_09459 [Spizellomyces punctatus DAOM BR117]|uniref:HMG box domain-containing protein n=1 Tax=Spizellomyces punctatus (strain DAOM BR117) TaxID=645134 RepID=A0A0L0H8U2_SPIPD|nr:uncharacterized protein SPPG_09459 [Spizellomyces punctatus DAOM BR117]KNC97359.1 hypothetical protein SPPG_09459 [Spizellomyces punctatus DAOM BR117]|eukprot:XP_016605399.1 hypothetical protein SPPG_09459 [Spizellomyces punctatus DAOM BR117]